MGERVRSYTVHEAPEPMADRVDRAEALQFVDDRFAIPALIAPPIWFAVHGIWWGVLAYVVAAGVIVGVATAFLVPGFIALLAILILHLICAAEAGEILRSHLERRGWTTIGEVVGTGRVDCERRFFDQWLPATPMQASASTGNASAPAPSPNPADAPRERPRAAAILGNLLAPRRR